MTGVGPLLAWRRSSVDSLKRNFTVPLLSGLAAGVLLFAFGMRHPYAILCFAMSAFVVVTIGSEFHRGVRARRAHRGGSYATALVDLVQRNTRRYGGYIVHFGIVLLFIGFAGNAFNKDVIADLNRGESTAIGPWKVTLQDLPSGETPVYNWLGAQVLLSKNDEPVGIFQPRRQLDKATGQATSEVRRHATFQEDIYLVFSGITEDGRATVHVYRNPLVRWVWLGAFVMFLGTVLTLLPNRSPVRRAATAPDGRRWRPSDAFPIATGNGRGCRAAHRTGRFQDRYNSADYQQVTHALTCQCGGCNAIVGECAMDRCPSSEPIREEVAERLQAGKPRRTSSPCSRSATAW